MSEFAVETKSESEVGNRTASGQLAAADGKTNEEVFELYKAQSNFCKGNVLTIIDAVFADQEQRKAVKDLIHAAFKRQLDHVGAICFGRYGAMEAVSPIVEEA